LTAVLEIEGVVLGCADRSAALPVGRSFVQRRCDGG
jgi:hypothetical protein